MKCFRRTVCSPDIRISPAVATGFGCHDVPAEYDPRRKIPAKQFILIDTDLNMSLPEVSDNYPPRVDFTMTPLAFGLRAVPRLVSLHTGEVDSRFFDPPLGKEAAVPAVYVYNRSKYKEQMKEMECGEVVVRRRALNSLAVYLVNPLHVQECLDCGVIRVLIVRLAEEDYLVRERTTACLELVSQQSRGCESILLNDVLETLRSRVDDLEKEVRLNAYNVFLNLSQDVKGAFEIANYDLTWIFVEKLHTEIPTAKKLLLEILHNIMDFTEIRQDVLTTPAMKYFTEYLRDSDDEEIRTGAARCIGDLAMETRGKSLANIAGTVEVLVKMLLDESTGSPLAPVTYALMMIMIDIEARYRVLQQSEDIFDNLLRLWSHPCLEVALNSVKIATLLAESPEGCAILNLNLKSVQELSKTPDAFMRRVVQALIKVLTWKP